MDDSPYPPTHVFLSGGTRGPWRDEILARFQDVTFYDPRSLSRISDMKIIAETEREWLDMTDVVFFYFEASNPSGLGSAFEVGYAIAKGIPVIFVDEKRTSHTEWLGIHCNYVTDNLADGLSQLEERYISRKNKRELASPKPEAVNLVIPHERLNDAEIEVFIETFDHTAENYAKLFRQASSKTDHDWNLGYIVRKLIPSIVEQALDAFVEVPPVSEGLAWGLGELGNDTPAVVRTLFSMLESGTDYDAWWCAAEALEKLRQGDATDLKKRTLTGEKWDDLEYCLERLDERPAIIGVLRQARLDNTGSTIVPRCREALKSRNQRLVRNGVWLLERLRVSDKETLTALAELYEAATDLSDDTMKPRIVEALGRIAAPSVRELLEFEVQAAKYYRTRAYAAMGLGRIGDTRSLDALRSALQAEKEPSVVSHISEAIYAISDKRIRSIQQVVRDSQWPENGMISDSSNFWYGTPEIYDAFANAEDPQGVSLDLLLALVPAGSQTVLELGMGTGRLTFHALKSRTDISHWVGTDISKGMCDYSHRKAMFFPGLASRLEIIEARNDNLPFGDGQFDAIVSAWAFPSKTWDADQAKKELGEVCRLLRPGGLLITLGWDEQFQDELSELWYKFVPEPTFRRESLNDWRSRRRGRLSSTRNCDLTFVARNVKVPLLYSTPEEAAHNVGYLFGHSAGEWVADQGRTEFTISIGVTCDTRESIAFKLGQADT